MASLDLLEQLLEVVVVERQRADEQRIQDDATRPHVGLAPVVLLATDDLWAGVVWRAAARLQHRAVRLQRCHAKVGDLDVQLVVEQQVLRLQVPVASWCAQLLIRPLLYGPPSPPLLLPDQVAVAEVQRRDDLPEEALRLFWRQTSALH